MPRVFVYEYLTAHGIGRDPGSPDHGMYREGRAMRDAILADLGHIPNVDLVILGPSAMIDPDCDGFTDEAAFRELAAASDYALLIAPEFRETLLQRVQWAIDSGTRLLSPNETAVRITANKLSLAHHWEGNGVRTPFTKQIWYWPEERFPLVLKPRFGVGSVGVRLVPNRDRFESLDAEAVVENGENPDFIAQDFVPGRPASVAFLVGPNQTVPLLPTFQRLSADGRFQYLGGELPIPPGLAARAVALGRKAIDCVPGLAGYVGVDLILGEAADGSEDYAIEINPRLTTSYVGLRALAETNLAGAMLDICQRKPVGPIRWKPGRVRFEPDGRVEYDPTPGAVWG